MDKAKNTLAIIIILVTVTVGAVATKIIRQHVIAANQAIEAIFVQ